MVSEDKLLQGKFVLASQEQKEVLCAEGPWRVSCGRRERGTSVDPRDLSD